MRLRTGLVALLTLIFGASAAFAVYLLAGRPAAEAEVETVSVVVAKEQIQRGDTLQESLLEMKPWPKEFVPEGAMTTIEDAIGRTVWIPLVPNDPVVESKLATRDSGQGLASLIPPGMRAVTIQTSNIAMGVAGFIMPGNKVDVLWTASQISRGDDTGGGSTITLLQNIEVLAVDQRLGVPQDNKVDIRETRTVTLLATPTEAAKLDLAQNRGTLRLSLRNPGDTSSEAVDMATLRGLIYPDGYPGAAGSPQPESIEFGPDGIIESFADGSTVETPTETPEPTDQPEAGGFALLTNQSPTTTEQLLEIRTLRGTSSGAVYFRKVLPAASLQSAAQSNPPRPNSPNDE